VILASLALADEANRTWETLWDAGLVESGDGRPDLAVRYHQDLLQDLRADPDARDEELADAWFGLGRARLTLGLVDDAVAALELARQHPSRSEAAGALLAQVELNRRAVRRLPLTWTFEDEEGGLVPTGPDRGTLELQDAGGNGHLAWRIDVGGGVGGEVAIRFAPGVKLHEVRLRVRATRFPIALRVAATDTMGGRYGADVLPVPTDRWIDVAFPVSAFQLAGGAGMGGRPIQTLLLEDVTGFLGAERGANTILLDDVVLR
jgi:hypothetical protein